MGDESDVPTVTAQANMEYQWTADIEEHEHVVAVEAVLDAARKR